MSWADYYNFARSANRYNPFVSDAAFVGGSYVSGLQHAMKVQESNQIQIGYDQYMKQGYQRAYDDWQRLYGSKGLKIRYPELSYPGAIAGYDAGISRAYISNDIASADFVASLPYRAGGLYGISGRAVRTL